jgi:hypothetical protein
MYVSKLWLIGIVLPLAACPAVKNEENDTLFSTLSATDTDPTDPGTSNVTNGTGDEESEESSATSGEGSESGPAGPCGDGVCAEPPPDGWFGPIVRWDNDGSMPPLCAEEWPDPAFTLMGGYVDPGPAECSCACGITVSSVCAGYGYVYSDGSCSSYISMVNAAQPCNEVEFVDGQALYLYGYSAGATPTCNDEVTMSMSEPTWSQEVRGCRGAELGDECGQGRQCLPKAPAGFENWLCIFAEGDLECPAGDYSEKTMLYSGVSDTRGCGSCICGAAPATTCTGNWEVFDNDDCTGNVVHTQPVSPYACSGALDGVGSFRIALDGGTECPIMTDTTPTGSIEPDGAFTYCCTPPPG